MVVNAKARPTPSMKTNRNSTSRFTQPPIVAQRSTMTAAASTTWAKATSRRRSNRSAAYPTTSTSSMDGKNWISPTRPRSSARWVNSYVCQPTATATIWYALMAANRAVRNLRNVPLSIGFDETGSNVFTMLLRCYGVPGQRETSSVIGTIGQRQPKPHQRSCPGSGSDWGRKPA